MAKLVDFNQEENINSRPIIRIFKSKRVNLTEEEIFQELNVKSYSESNRLSAGAGNFLEEIETHQQNSPDESCFERLIMFLRGRYYKGKHEASYGSN